MTDTVSPPLDERNPRSAERALRVMEVLLARTQPAPAAWIARECGIPRSSVYPILAVLARHGIAHHDASRRLWSLGTRVHEVGADHPTLGECVAVLNAFDRRTALLDPGEIARRGGLALERTTRALVALQAEGLVSHTGDGRFGLGLYLAALAARIGPVERLRTAARQALATLRDETGETANLLIRDGNTVLYLDQIESQRALRHTGWAGRAVPLAGTAVGNALLSDGGVFVAVDAVEVGVTAVSARIPADEFAAVVSITGPSARLRGGNLDVARRQVAAAAREISDALKS